MAEGRDRHLWNHTSAVLAMLANANRDTKKRKRPFGPDEFNPYESRSRGATAGIPVTAENIHVLKVLIGSQRRGNSG